MYCYDSYLSLWTSVGMNGQPSTTPSCNYSTSTHDLTLLFIDWLTTLLVLSVIAAREAAGNVNHFLFISACLCGTLEQWINNKSITKQ